MPPLTILWRIARRDLNARFRGLRLLAICLFLGVTALATIGSLTSGISAELSNRGQAILGGDIQLELAQREASDAELRAMTELGQLSRTIRLRAMARKPGGTGGEAMLAELKAVDNAYPLYGQLTLDGNRTATAPGAGTIYIGRNLADRLALARGDMVRFGDADFRISGIIADEPDRLGEGFTLGPVALISFDDLDRTALIQPGSLYNVKYRIKLPAGQDPAAAVETLKSRLPDAGWEITDRSNGAPGTRRFIERMGQFLTLVGLAALVIAGIGVGNGVSSYLEGKRGSIATLKIIGADSATIFRLYMLQILTIASLAILAGLVTGTLLPILIGTLAADMLPVAPGFALYPLPLIISAAYGMLIAIAFALPPLAHARIVPPAALFRTLLDKRMRPDRGTVLRVTAALGTIITLAVMTSRDPGFSAGFIAAAIILLLLLTLIGQAIVLIARRMPKSRYFLPRLAIGNLHRPGAQTGMLVVALGLGLTLFVTLSAIQGSINNEIARSVPERAPSFFALDIPRDDAPRFLQMVQDAAPDAQINMIPALRGAITAFAGQRVDELETLPEGAWILNGDRGLTYSPTLPKGSRIVAGKWWPADYDGAPQVSMDRDVAASLNVGLGDDITINLLGVEITARISSLRELEWDNFGLNYAMVFSPGSIDRAPHNMVATITVPKDQEGAIARAIPDAFPSTSLIEVGEVVNQVTQLLSQMARAIAAAGSIAILAGIAVLVGAMAAGRAARAYDYVILKTLGSGRGQILAVQAMEYFVLATLLGLVALALGLGAAWFVVTQIFEFTFAPDRAILAATLLGGGGLIFLLGLGGSLPLLNVRPAQALRDL